MKSEITAAVIVIGDEVLSGRTKDTNSNTIALFLTPLGIQLKEVRVIGDVEDKIVNTVNELRKEHNYVFTTGGIGPTHDDITADAIAKAFNVPLLVRDDAIEMMLNRYKKEELTEARLRMARIPEGASLIKNPVSWAPGFQTGNVFTMAGVPNIMKAMLEDIAPRLETGRVVISKTVKADGLKEGDIAMPLAEIAKAYPKVSFGSYPWFNGDGFGCHIVARSFEEKDLELGLSAIVAMLDTLNLRPIIE